MNPNHKTILVTAYAINPFKGSENGMGWQFINEAARSYRVIAITRENNIPHIERYLEAHGEPHHQNVQFVGYDLPKRWRFWKRGEMTSLIYFYLWQRTMPAFIWRQGFQFDLAHNLNFHNDWTPSFLWKLGKPFVWGPIGHHPLIPKAFLKGIFPAKERFKDRFRWMIKKAFWKLSPSLKKSARRADVIIGMNKSVLGVFPGSKDRIQILPSAGTEHVPWTGVNQTPGMEILSVGRFVSLKGFDVTIRSFAQFFHGLEPSDRVTTRLTLIGQGPYKAMLQALAKEQGVEDRVTFIDWVNRGELDQFYRKAHLFLFPSHEGAGMVVPEALSYGLPVLCFGNCGPGEFITPESGMTVPYGTYDDAVADFARYLNDLFYSPETRKALSEGARCRFEEEFDWEEKGKKLREIYARVLEGYSVDSQSFGPVLSKVKSS